MSLPHRPFSNFPPHSPLPELYYSQFTLGLAPAMSELAEDSATISFPTDSASIPTEGDYLHRSMGYGMNEAPWGPETRIKEIAVPLIETEFKGTEESGLGVSMGEELESTEVMKKESDEFDQAFYDPFRIKHRRRTSPDQLRALEEHFQSDPKPDVVLRRILSDQINMTAREVQVWVRKTRFFFVD